MQNDFLLIRSYGSGNALARVQSDPITDGLAELGQSVRKLVYTPGSSIDVSTPKYLLVSYDDNDALLRAQALKRRTNCKVICLGSDIYYLDRYAAIAEITDLFVMPTEAHKEVLESVVWEKVIVIPEAVDSIALCEPGNERPVERNNQICWFGYPESFHKAFKYIFDEALARSGIPKSHLTFITSTSIVEGVRHLHFHEKSFYAMTQQFGYTLLSHFAFDCHINSFAKSPNKLITSLVRGMMPLASRTRNYEDVMRHYNLEALMFSNGNDLVNLLRNLDADRDNSRYDLKAISLDLQERFSARNNAKLLLDALN